MPCTRPLDSWISSLRCISTPRAFLYWWHKQYSDECLFIYCAQMHVPLPPLHSIAPTHTCSRVLACTQTHTHTHTHTHTGVPYVHKGNIRFNVQWHSEDIEWREGEGGWAETEGWVWHGWRGISFKWRGGWKAKKKEDARREEMRVAKRQWKAARVERRGWMWAKISAWVRGNEEKREKEGKEEYPLHHCVTGNLIEGER